MVPTSYVWFSCARDFRLLVLSVASVLTAGDRRGALFISQDAANPMLGDQIEFVESLSSRVHVLKDASMHHLGVSGLASCHRLCQIHREVAHQSGSANTTKIDSDCLMFADTMTPILATSRFMLVGVWAEWGAWGAYCAYHRTVWNHLAAMSASEYGHTIAAASEHRNNFDEDHVHPRLTRFLWRAESVLLRVPDWTSGWFDAYQFEKQHHPDKIDVLELRKKSDFFDVVEFGRRRQMRHLVSRGRGDSKLQEKSMLQALRVTRSERPDSFWTRRG